MNFKQILGLAAFVLGICLVVYSVQMMDTFRESVAMKITGKYSKETMWYLVGGILLVIFGGSSTVIFRANGKRKK